ncbi:MAG TPA: alpha/beta fold hydrolase [Azospirillaceae bacterium]|nr:alpha/beta fold hydrolase [Azospirillaceae bacterium]
MTIEPFILLPGLLNDAGLWAHQTRHLADVAETRVGDLTVADSMGALADAVLADAPERFALAGLSMGGYVAFEILRRAPGRVTRLALLDTTARPDLPEQTERRRTLIGIAEAGRFGLVVPQLLPNLVHPDHLSVPAITDMITGMAHRVGPQAFVRQQKAIIGRADSRPDLASIRCPTLVVCGRQDGLTPLPVMEEIASGIVGARLAVVEDAGHLTPLERPQAVTALLRLWLLYG